MALRVHGFRQIDILKVRDRNKNNKLIYFCINVLEKQKTILTKFEGLKSINLSALPVNVDRYIKARIRVYVDKVYTNFHGLNVLEDGVECESFKIISIDSLFVYENRYDPHMYLDNFIYKILNTEMVESF